MQFTPLFLDKIRTSGFVEQVKNGVLTIDNSEFATWGSCFVMGLYAGALKRVNARARAPLTFGAAIHVGLESFFRGEPDWLAKAHAEAAAEGLDGLGDPKRNTTKMEDLLLAYTLEYSRMRSMQFDILTIDGVPAVEKPFVVPLGETGPIRFDGEEVNVRIMWSGKIDLLTKYEGAITPVDHKTTTVMGDKFIDDKVRGNQTIGYTYASRYLAKTIFKDAPVFGVRINALAMRTAGFEFKQFDLPYPDWKVAEWQQETICTISDLIEQLGRFISLNRTTAIATPTREHCVTKYGKCPYFDVCDTIPVMRDRMIFDDSYYFVSDWSPLD